MSRGAIMAEQQAEQRRCQGAEQQAKQRRCAGAGGRTHRKAALEPKTHTTKEMTPKQMTRTTCVKLFRPCAFTMPAG